MIIVRTYSEIDKQDWRLLAETSPLSTWFQTDEAYRFYQSVSDICAFVYGVLEEDKLVGVIVGYTTQEKCQLKQHFTARSIIVGGPLIADNISNEALSALLSAIAQCKVEGLKLKVKSLKICGYSF